MRKRKWHKVLLYLGPSKIHGIGCFSDARIKKGEFVALIGHSGCGKSTVLSMVAGLNDVTGGGMILAGKELVGPGPDRGIVFQSPCLLPWFTAFENVMLGVDQVFYTASKTEREQIAEYYLHIVGLGDSMHKRPSELSQGMRQRVGIARAIIAKPALLIADEPTGNLDPELAVEIMNIFKRFNEVGVTVLIASHDVNLIERYGVRRVMLENGRVSGGGVREAPFELPSIRVN